MKRSIQYPTIQPSPLPVKGRFFLSSYCSLSCHGTLPLNDYSEWLFVCVVFLCRQIASQCHRTHTHSHTQVLTHTHSDFGTGQWGQTDPYRFIYFLLQAYWCVPLLWNQSLWGLGFMIAYCLIPGGIRVLFCNIHIHGGGSHIRHGWMLVGGMPA